MLIAIITHGVCFVTCGKVLSIRRILYSSLLQYQKQKIPSEWSRKTRGKGNIVGERWWRFQGGRDDNGGGAVANVIALPRSFPRVRGNQENNEWLGCSATALPRRERNNEEREREKWHK